MASNVLTKLQQDIGTAVPELQYIDRGALAPGVFPCFQVLIAGADTNGFHICRVRVIVASEHNLNPDDKLLEYQSRVDLALRGLRYVVGGAIQTLQTEEPSNLGEEKVFWVTFQFQTTSTPESVM